MFFSALRSRGAAFRAGQKIDQRLDVEAAQHGAEQLRRADLGDEGGRLLALRDLRQELGLDLGGVVHARRHAVGDQVDEECFLARWRIFQQGNQFGGLLLRQRQGRNPEGGAFSGLGAIGFEHGSSLNACFFDCLEPVKRAPAFSVGLGRMAFDVFSKSGR